MKIMRDGKEYELTSEELAAANTEFVTNFMKSELMGRCEISDEELAEELAEQAYDRYCEGNGETEGECIDWAYYSWLESVRKERFCCLVAALRFLQGCFFGEKKRKKEEKKEPAAASTAGSMLKKCFVKA